MPHPHGRGREIAIAVAVFLALVLTPALPASAAQPARVGLAVEDGPLPAPEPTFADGFLIVATAQQYLGYPYVFDGNTPWGFDCSGFTQWVVAEAIGVDITHGLWEQTNYGVWIEWGQWHPGDLVFFADTWNAGLSHVGIYVADGVFIHAEMEETGVTYDSIYSDFYAWHYYGAIRIVV